VDALYPPVPATDVAADLAQCPVWDAAKRQLVWVDALGGALLTGAVRIERIGTSVLARVEGHVSFVAPGEDGGYVLQSDGSHRVAASQELGRPIRVEVVDEAADESEDSEPSDEQEVSM